MYVCVHVCECVFIRGAFSKYTCFMHKTHNASMESADCMQQVCVCVYSANDDKHTRTRYKNNACPHRSTHVCMVYLCDQLRLFRFAPFFRGSSYGSLCSCVRVHDSWFVCTYVCMMDLLLVFVLKAVPNYASKTTTCCMQRFSDKVCECVQQENVPQSLGTYRRTHQGEYAALWLYLP